MSKVGLRTKRRNIIGGLSIYVSNTAQNTVIRMNVLSFYRILKHKLSGHIIHILCQGFEAVLNNNLQLYNKCDLDTFIDYGPEESGGPRAGASV